MIFCMDVAVFADDNTTILTADIPDNTPTYSFNFPASVSLEYGNTGPQEVGVISVRDVEYCDSIFVTCDYTDLINIADPSDQLELFWSPDLSSNNVLTIYKEGAYMDRDLYTKVMDWSAATPGATYQATVTYVIECD